MTGDPAQDIAALRTEVAALRTELAALHADVAALAHHLGGLQARLPTTTTTPTPPAPVAAGPPQGWAQQADPHAWADLRAWVTWLHETYDLTPARAVLPCWPAHPGAVEELAALHACWQQTAATGGEAAITWHERRLHPTLTRLRENYQLLGCTETHRTPRPARPTDPELFTGAGQTERPSPAARAA